MSKTTPKDYYTINDSAKWIAKQCRQVFGCKTEYHGPTDHRGSRVIATHLRTKKRITRPWRDELDVLENHIIVAAELLDESNLSVCSVEGGGYIFLVQ
jgi:hypothetical protein